METAAHEAEGDHDEAPVEEVPSAAAEPAAGDAVDIACGRWTARLPVGARATPGGYSRGGPQSCTTEVADGIDPRGVSGVVPTLVVTDGTCEVMLSGAELAPAALTATTPSVRVIQADDGGVVEAVSADGAELHLELDAADGCGAFANGIVLLFARTLAAAPLGVGGAVHLTLSTSGHGLDLALPAGIYAVAHEGMFDAFETVYELRSADGRPLVTIYSAWSGEGDPSAPMRGFHAEVRGRVRPIRASSEVYEPSELCTATATMSITPEPRIGTDVYFCVTGDEADALEMLLRAGHFTQPWPAVEDVIE